MTAIMAFPTCFLGAFTQQQQQQIQQQQQEQANTCFCIRACPSTAEQLAAEGQLATSFTPEG
jgi:hypothetical protein